jgi:hypothetical protein
MSMLDDFHLLHHQNKYLEASVLLEQSNTNDSECMAS